MLFLCFILKLHKNTVHNGKCVAKVNSFVGKIAFYDICNCDFIEKG